MWTCLSIVTFICRDLVSDLVSFLSFFPFFSFHPAKMAMSSILHSDDIKKAVDAFKGKVLATDKTSLQKSILY